MFSFSLIFQSTFCNGVAFAVNLKIFICVSVCEYNRQATHIPIWYYGKRGGRMFEWVLFCSKDFRICLVQSKTFLFSQHTERAFSEMLETFARTRKVGPSILACDGRNVMKQYYVTNQYIMWGMCWWMFFSRNSILHSFIPIMHMFNVPAIGNAC